MASWTVWRREQFLGSNPWSRSSDLAPKVFSWNENLRRLAKVSSFSSKSFFHPFQKSDLSPCVFWIAAVVLTFVDWLAAYNIHNLTCPENIDGSLDCKGCKWRDSGHYSSSQAKEKSPPKSEAHCNFPCRKRIPAHKEQKMAANRWWNRWRWFRLFSMPFVPSNKRFSFLCLCSASSICNIRGRNSPNSLDDRFVTGISFLPFGTNPHQWMCRFVDWCHPDSLVVVGHWLSCRPHKLKSSRRQILL